jgi:hypothetical protein
LAPAIGRLRGPRCSICIPSRQSTLQDAIYLGSACCFAPLTTSSRSVDYILGPALLATQFLKNTHTLRAGKAHPVAISCSSPGASSRSAAPCAAGSLDCRQSLLPRAAPATSPATSRPSAEWCCACAAEAQRGCLELPMSRATSREVTTGREAALTCQVGPLGLSRWIRRHRSPSSMNECYSGPIEGSAVRARGSSAMYGRPYLSTAPGGLVAS